MDPGTKSRGKAWLHLWCRSWHGSAARNAHRKPQEGARRPRPSSANNIRNIRIMHPTSDADLVASRTWGGSIVGCVVGRFRHHLRSLPRRQQKLQKGNAVAVGLVSVCSGGREGESAAEFIFGC